MQVLVNTTKTTLVNVIPRTIIMTMIEQNTSTTIAPQNMNILIGNTDCNLLLDSDRGCTFLNLSLAKHIMLNCVQAKRSEK